MLRISVIICTYNPRTDYLARVLNSLKLQTLSMEQWELLLVDNASTEPLVGIWDLSWHPQARHVREDELGLTRARLRSIKESKGELLVFVDDDNVLAADYLSTAVTVANEYPRLGVWSGTVLPEFERSPDPATEAILSWLCIRKLERDYWGNYLVLDNAPNGAGMCSRRSVANTYVQTIMRSAIRQRLGRVGNGLSGWEDLDLALCSIDIGFGMGLFEKLRVSHLIPSRRLEHSYLLKLAEDLQMSRALFLGVRGIESPLGCRVDRLAGEFLWWYRWLRANPFLKRFLLAERRGVKRGRAVIRQNSL